MENLHVLLLLDWRIKKEKIVVILDKWDILYAFTPYNRGFLYFGKNIIWVTLGRGTGQCNIQVTERACAQLRP